MKKILFAIAMEKLDYSKAEAFEKRVISSLKSGSREYSNLQPYYCDHKDGILRMCKQKDIDVLVVNENVQGQGDLLSILKEVKSEFPAMLIVILLTSNRNIGDAFLANAVTAGVYNWLASPWTPEDLANIIISPKKLKNVEMYMPKIIEGKDGLAFDTVIVEKKQEDSLEDLPDIFDSNNNGVDVNGIDDLEAIKENKNIGYSRKLSQSKFGFGKIHKPKKVEEEKTSEDLLLENTQDIESLTEEPLPILDEPVQKVEKHEESSSNMSFADFLKQRSLEESQEISAPEEKTEELPALEPVEESYKPEPVKEVKTDTLKEDKIKNKKNKYLLKEEKPLTKTLSSISFNCKYNSILFIRALPVSSAIPVHIAKLTNYRFVDFNKNNTSMEGYFDDMIKTSVKECCIPEGPIVGDVVAGNGVEKLIDKFEHVVVIMPEDIYTIETFKNRYSYLKNCGVVIDRSTTGVLTRKQLASLFPNCLYIDTVKTENCLKDVVQSCANKTLLMDNPDYYLALKYLLKDLEA